MKNKKIFVKEKCCKCIFNNKNFINSNDNYNQNNIDYIVNKPLDINKTCINCKQYSKNVPIYPYLCLVNTNSLKYCIFNNQTQQKARSYRNFLLSQPKCLDLYKHLYNKPKYIYYKTR